jgi:LysM repeat protein
MASKASFNANEWELIKDAPEWVHAALSAAEGRAALMTSVKENKGFSQAVANYKPQSQLIRDVIEDKGKPAKALKGATLSDAEQALKQIAGILDNKVSRQEADEFRTFLLSLGQSVAEAAGEGLLGMGQKVSQKESSALGKIAVALKATEADKKARIQAEAAAKAREEAAAKAKLEAEEARRKQEAAAKAKLAAEEARKKQAAVAQAKREADEVRRKQAEAAAKAKLEAEEARKEQQAMAQAKRQADEARRKQAEAAAKAKLEAEEARKEQQAMAQAKLDAAAKAKQATQMAAATLSAETNYIAEHTVVSGDSLSGIALKYYGSTARDKWMLIYEENKKIIGDNPNLIRPGQVFKIPKLP